MKDKLEDILFATQVFALLLLGLSAVVGAVALVLIAVDINSFVNGDAWDAPWLNVINRGPVQ